MKVKYVDPPLGYLYGFPAILKDGVTYKDLLIEHKYPVKDIELALQYSWVWEEEVDTQGHQSV